MVRVRESLQHPAGVGIWGWFVPVRLLGLICLGYRDDSAPERQTDVDNLIPICNRHHHLVHEGGWQLHLAPDHTLTITQPGGNISITGPPKVRAA